MKVDPIKFEVIRNGLLGTGHGTLYRMILEAREAAGQAPDDRV